jgi:hypothetical protein
VRGDVLIDRLPPGANRGGLGCRALHQRAYAVSDELALIQRPLPARMSRYT